MNKKKLKKMLRRAFKQSAVVPAINGQPAANPGAHGSDGQGSGTRPSKGLLGGLGLPRGFLSGPGEQFILGALLGAAGAYVLADEALRNKIVKSAMRLYAGVSGGIEEFKEQIGDLKAELEAEQGV